MIGGLIGGRLQGVDHKTLADDMENVMEELGVISFYPESLAPERHAVE